MQSETQPLRSRSPSWLRSRISLGQVGTPTITGWTRWRTSARCLQSRADTSARIKRLTPDSRQQAPATTGSSTRSSPQSPVGALPYLDNPAYGSNHPIYPLLAGVAAGCNPGVVPWTLLALGIVGVVAATFALATIAYHQGISPWYGALAALAGLFLVPRLDGLDGRSPTRRRRLALIWHRRCNP